MNSNHTIALEQALAWINSNFNPIAIIASGSIIRGNVDKNSDFDIYVIHEDHTRQRVQKLFNAVPCEIFINNLNHIYSYFEKELANNRPVTANIIATGKILKGNEDQRILTLIEDAKKFMSISPQLNAEQLLLHKYAIANLLEDATDILQHDPVTALYILDKTILQAIELIFLVNKQPLPRIKERIVTILQIEPSTGLLLQQYYTSMEVSLKYELAKKIVLIVTGNHGFFEWSSTAN